MTGSGGPEARVWMVGATSGVVAALLCAGMLMAAGAVDRPPPLCYRHGSAQHSARSTTANSGRGTPNATGHLRLRRAICGRPDGERRLGRRNGSGVVVSSSGPTCYVLTDSVPLFRRQFQHSGPGGCRTSEK